MSFAAITLSVASQVFIVVYFVTDSVQKLLYTPSYLCCMPMFHISDMIH
jgi:hypothetical protein